MIQPLQPFNLSDSLSSVNPNEGGLDVNIGEYSALQKDIYLVEREKLLNHLSAKQSFYVSTGKSKWVIYQTFNPAYNLRQILDDEIVIEFDSIDEELVIRAIGETGINLRRAGYTFEYWDHKGKSPHLHIRDLPIGNLSAEKRALFKKVFIRKYVPLDYLSKVDLSLTGVHMIAIEWALHWKSTLKSSDKDYNPNYGVKRLIHIFDEKEIV